MAAPGNDGTKRGSAPREGVGHAPGDASNDDHLRRVQDYFRARLAATGVSMRQLSLAMRPRDPTYVAQLLAWDDKSGSRRRALPSPAELRRAAPLLGASLADLLEVVWQVAPEEQARQVPAVDHPLWDLARVVGDLNDDEWDLLREFAAYLRWRQGKAASTSDSRQGEKDSPSV